MVSMDSITIFLAAMSTQVRRFSMNHSRLDSVFGS